MSSRPADAERAGSRGEPAQSSRSPSGAPRPAGSRQFIGWRCRRAAEAIMPPRPGVAVTTSDACPSEGAYRTERGPAQFPSYRFRLFFFFSCSRALPRAQPSDARNARRHGGPCPGLGLRIGPPRVRAARRWISGRLARLRLCAGGLLSVLIVEKATHEGSPAPSLGVPGTNALAYVSTDSAGRRVSRTLRTIAERDWASGRVRLSRHDPVLYPRRGSGITSSPGTLTKAR